VAEEDVAMSEESVPPKGLLERMEELMAALNADLSALEDLRAAGEPGWKPAEGGGIGRGPGADAGAAAAGPLLRP
jgi:hypothetical protein